MLKYALHGAWGNSQISGLPNVWKCLNKEKHQLDFIVIKFLFILFIVS